MASKDRQGSRKVNPPKFSRKDRQVKPTEERDTNQENKRVESNELKTVSKQVENKMSEKELKRIRKVEEQRMEDIDKDNRRMKRRMLRKKIRKDIVQTSSESCSTFCFVFIVGSTLLGGGSALVVSGRENDVFDFVVVGATGLVCGVIFTVTGIYLFVKPLYDRHMARKTAELDLWGAQNVEETTKPYIENEHADMLKSQIHDDKRQRRRPSNSDLYGEDIPFDNVDTVTTPREESFTSYTKPPYLAVPNNERESFSKKPVLLLDAKEKMSPKKGKPSATTATTTTANPNSSVGENSSNSRMASFSQEDETKHKVVHFSQENEVKQYELNETRSLNESKTQEEKDKSDSGSTDARGKDSEYDKILKQVSRNTIVVDYSLMNEFETPPPTPGAAPPGGRSDIDQSTTSRHSRKNKESETTNQIYNTVENVAAQNYNLDLTEKLFEKHPDIAEKHKKRSKRRKRESEKGIKHHNTQSEITIPLDDSEIEGAVSIC